jgi:glutathione S-transferase
MSSEPSVTLYDITSKLDPKAWYAGRPLESRLENLTLFSGAQTHGKPGLHSHRISSGSHSHSACRIVLNYKRIPYKTVWVSYPDIEPTLIKLGCAATTSKPGDPAKPYYTLPAIVDASSSPPVVIADSLAIAEYLDEKYPDRPVFPKQGKALEYAFEEYFKSVVMPHLGQIMLPVTSTILDDRGSEYFQRTRAAWFGKPLEQLSPEGEVRDGHWKAIEAALDKLAGLLEKNGPGVDYVAGGTEPTRADIIQLSFLLWVKVVLPDEWEKRFKHWNGGRWERLLRKTEEWQTVI